MSVIPFKWTRSPENRRHLTSLSPLEDVFDHFFNDLASWEKETATSPTFSPAINVVEGEKEFTVEAELPGLTDADVELSLEKNVLTLKGEKKASHEESGKNFRRIERSYGSFFRVIPFQVELNPEKVEAEFKNGVLNIRLAKAPSAIREAKKISIKS